MKKILIFVLLLFLFIPNIKASYIVMDSDNNRVITGNAIHTKRSVASISKIMTAILAIESNKLNEDVIIGNEIEGSYGSGIYIKKGEKLKLIDLVYGLMLRSGNDAALAIASYVCKDEESFVLMMNKKAKELNMVDTTFNNPNGLEYNGGNISTAYDMALLSSYAIKNDIYRKIVGTKKYNLKTNLNTYIWINKNKLLRIYNNAIGGKTGYTEIAKRTLVTNAYKNNVLLTTVTLNESDDFNAHKNFYETYFKQYKKYTILKKGNIDILDYKVKNGNFYIKNTYKISLKDDERSDIIIKYVVKKNYSNVNNSKIGKVQVKLYDKVIYSQDIYINFDKQSIFEKIRAWFND